MRQTTAFGLFCGAMALAAAGAGAGLLRHAHSMHPPATPAMRTLPGTVSGMIVTQCGAQNRRYTCYRPAVDYDDGGARRQILSRRAYSPTPPHASGSRVNVLIEPDGTPWIASEWETRQAERLAEIGRRRAFPTWMGWILIGCGAFSGLLGLGLVFFVDRSDEAPAPRR